MNNMTDNPLDRFAEAPEPRNAVIPAQAYSPVGHRIIGAQPVAVQRDENKVRARLRRLGAEAGEHWFYRFPVRNKRENRTDWIEGPTIKLANDLAREYGNCKVGVVAIEDIGDSWRINAEFIDWETGYSLNRWFQQRKSISKLGGDDDGRRLDSSLQIGESKAIRNVVLNALQTFADFAFEEAKRSLVDRIGKDLDTWRTNTVARLADHVALDRVEAVIGRLAKNWLAPDVARVIAMMRAVQDGMASLNDTFPPLSQPADPKAQALDALDQFAAEAPEAAANAAVPADDPPVNSVA